MKSFTNSRKFLFGVSVSMVLAMAIGSFALGESQTQASPQEVEAQSAVGANVGAFTVNGGTQGTDFDYASSVLTIHSGNLTVSTTAQTSERIVVDGAATITLAGVNISTGSGPALQIQDNATFDVNILLADGSNNILKATANDYAGLQKNGEGDNIGTLTIGVPDGSAGTGKLEATGGYMGAGIGGRANVTTSNITITNITITGGEVTATGGDSGAGIGGGRWGNGSNITITGGVVAATGGVNGAGIGGGSGGSGSYITITGGKVTANGGVWGAGIGSAGLAGDSSYITISGGEVTATAGENVAAGIGSAANTYRTTRGEHIKISGGIVKAYGTASGNYCGAGIGGVTNGGDPGNANNELDGDAVVLAVSGGTRIDALQGFADDQGNSLLTKGIAFTQQTTSGTYNSAMYGDVTLSQDLEIPANLTVPANQILSIKEGKEVTLSEETGAKYTVEGELQNNGTVTLPADLAFSGNGKVTTKTDFYLDDDSLYSTGYQTYQTSAGVQKYKNLPNPYQLDPSNGKRLINWYYLNQASQEVAISENVNVLLNEHSFHENSIEQFTVTFSVPTGTAPAAQTIDTGSKATDPQLSWTDGTVEGWYKEQSFTNKWNFGTDTVTENITLYAKFQCTVTFNPNYSGGSSTTGTAVYNNPVAEPTTPPVRIGYRFDGWYKESACTNKWTFTTAVTRNTTLYAKWVQQFTVTFNVPTGTAPAAQTVDTGSKATDPQLSWTDGTVEGWYKDQAFTPANKWNFSTDTVTGDITLYAKFQCTVTFDPNYSGGSEITSQTVVYDNTVPEPDEPTRDGYSVGGWYKDEECTNLWDFENDKVQGDMTLYAKWLGDEHNVIIPTNPDDHGTVTTNPENPKTGDEVIITVTPEEGYEIDGLPIVKTEDGRIIEVIPTGNPNEYKFIMPDSDVAIEVNFVLISEPEVKTGDSFAGIAALAILGVATTGAVLVRKRK